jgi:aminopeptidase N
MRRLVLILLVAACGDGHGATPDAALTPATANPGREVIDTGLVVDLAAMTTVATITFGASTDVGASLEIEGLTIDSVTSNGAPILYASADTKQLDLGLPASDQQLAVVISYHWKDHEGFTGISSGGWTLDWPYYCGNVFPCHSQPSDGTTFSLDLQNVPDGKMAVFPATIPNQAPAYQLAWTYDVYTQLDLGTTDAGTLISTWYRTGEEAKATAGTAHLVAAFNWLETTLGPYQFGNHFGSASVKWPPGQIGGMEHHPFIHIGGGIDNENTQVHEASHGWFGDGIRLECWEDFVLSEGTVSYLANRALDVVAPTVGAASWAADTQELAAQKGTDLVWPQSCGVVDVIKDKLFTDAPYMRGAFFYKAIADNPNVGAEKLDQALAAFYAAHKGGAAKMSDMLATIQQVTGYDPTACAQKWLLDLSSATPPTPAPFP